MIVTILNVGLNRKVRKPHRRTQWEHKNITVRLGGVRWFSKACRDRLRTALRLHYEAGWSLSGFAFVKEHRHVTP
jgi:hypothetical protein